MGGSGEGASPCGLAARWRVLARLAQIGELARWLNVQLRAEYGNKGGFSIVRTAPTDQTIPVMMRISLLINTIQPDHSILKSIHEGDSVSTKTLGKKHFS